VLHIGMKYITYFRNARFK